MIESMTGYGSGQANADGITVTIEIRSVNNRFCDVVVHAPRALAALEMDIQQRTKAVVERGKVTLSVRIDVATGGPERVRLDENATAHSMRILEQLREITGVSEPVRLENILSFPDVLVKEQIEDLSELSKDAVMQSLDSALTALRTMRRNEGEALEKDLLGRLSTMVGVLDQIEDRSPDRVRLMGEKLRERVSALKMDGKVDEQRLAMEIALLSDRLDITEECVRLRSHVDLFRQAVTSAESTGRRLNFLAQEMNREINTIGAKANDTEIAHMTVSLKEELEKIREQVQNVQ
jgi:uncharacterized protein (TIGR00255 family)